MCRFAMSRFSNWLFTTLHVTQFQRVLFLCTTCSQGLPAQDKEGSTTMDVGNPSNERTPLQPPLKLSTSPSEPSPLQRTPTSDYLVLSRVDSYNQDIQLPRPRFWYILTLFGVLDAAYTISAASTFGVRGKNEIMMVVLGLCRAVVIMLATSHRRIREIGWIIVGFALVCAMSFCSLWVQSMCRGLMMDH